MTIRFRRLIFYSLFIIFIPLSAGIILYSQGWRFDFKTFSAQKTGAIYIETKPKNVVIEINGKYSPDRSGIIQSGTLISDLLPKIYRLAVKKTGYFPYYKNLEVKPSMVSELIDTILIPEKFKETEITPNRLKGDEISAWDADNKKIIVKNSKNDVYYFYELNNLSSVFNISASLNNLSKKFAAKKISFYRLDSNKLIVESDKNELYIFDINKLKLEPLFLNSSDGRLLSWDVKNQNIYFIKNKTLSSFNLAAKTETELVEMPVKNKKTVKIIEIKSSSSGENISILDDFDDLYIFNVKTRNLKQIAHNAETFAFSPDDKKIAFSDRDGKLNIYFMEDYLKNISKKSGDEINFNLSNKELIKNIYWHNDSYHLFIEYGNGKNKKINFMEIDDRLPLNIYPIVEKIKYFYYGVET
ncbi:PD40 domain-containing protein, partial [Candidatus Wolfebacteria bacterium]|nr:PD40 domain-containing protein [Candidatus Wolfebacteria bacterium]